MRILLGEDDGNIASHVMDALIAENYTVDHFDNGPDVYDEGAHGAYAAIILDLGLPGMDGLSILKRWRKAGLTTPVLVLTARGSWMERVDGFDAGADDYIPKPFRSEELLARLRALLRRAGLLQPAARIAGRFTLDDTSRRITYDGKLLDLSPLEYRLIACLINNRGKVLTAYEIATEVQGRDDDQAKNAVEAMIARLRKKIGPDSIETRRGFGYVLPDDAA